MWKQAAKREASGKTFNVADMTWERNPGYHITDRIFQVVLVIKNLLANEGDIRDTDSIPGSVRSPGAGHRN